MNESNASLHAIKPRASSTAAWWLQPLAACLSQVEGSATGLSGAAAEERLRRYGPNLFRDQPQRSLLVQFQIDGLSEEEIDQINRAWHRLSPWPDSVGGLNRLKTRYTLSTLSNGNVSLLVDMAKNAGLPWDCVLSAEVFNHYKPDPEVYLGAAKLLGPKPGQVMMVAAHMDDLLAAKKLGLRTALVTRPLEFGPDRKADTAADGEGVVDIVASDFVDLAVQLGT